MLDGSNSRFRRLEWQTGVSFPCPNPGFILWTGQRQLTLLDRCNAGPFGMERPLLSFTPILTGHRSGLQGLRLYYALC